ncbi:MAG: glycoside hydrolase family 3 C-terminal domain-containing protein [Muribaculaceae bacterium]|nr:glycoside hydrolase family 3 C-terminal domain-containing protein [Muribaculaceae bacterium]
MKQVLALIMCGATIWGSMAAEKLPYQDASLPTETRVEDLLRRMTLEEKIAQMSHIHSWQIYDDQKLNKEKLKEKCGELPYGFFEGFPLTGESVKNNFRDIQKYIVEQTRLGIPAFPCGESLHGVVHEGCTVYPQTIAVGSTFNTDLAQQMTKYISGELNTLGMKQVFAPCMDVVREIRWGRTEESFGEDPWLCSVMSLAQVRGYLEGGTSPMLKHYGPHGKPNSGLNIASVECGTRDLFDVYLKPFEMVVENTPAMAVMSSYNSWNHVPNSASRFLLTDVLRGKFGFRGYVYTDWGTLNMLKNVHRTAETNFDAACQGLTAGIDAEASSNTFSTLAENIEAGLFDESYVDEAVRRILRAKIETGLMDDPYLENCAFYLPMRSNEGGELARRIADESVVMLKNEDNLLPLDINKVKKVAVIGPNAATVQFGDYTWSKNSDDGISPLEGIKSLVGDKVKVGYARGCSISSLDTTEIAEAVALARESDVALVFVGSSSTVFVRESGASTSGEGVDLSEIELTGAQEQLVRAVAATGKPVVLVLVSGKPFAMPWEAENIPAILVQWYGGEKEGESIANILFGNVNPSGKLNFSFPRSTGQLPVYYNYLPSDKGYYKNPGTYDRPGRDYVFSSPLPLWSFGHGLSYTDFDYVSAKTDKDEYQPFDTIRVTVDVKNTGKRVGKEVVQVYVRDVVSTIVTPIRQLKGFDKIEIKPGDTETVTIKVPVKELYLTDEMGNRYLEPGKFEIQVGKSSTDIQHILPVWVGEKAKKENLTAGMQTKKRSATGKKVKMRTITGSVRDIQATPLEGVVVTCDVSDNKAVTDVRGNYSIEVPEEANITFTKPGYSQYSKYIKGNNTVNVQIVRE